MVRLLSLEYNKLRKTRYFWVLSILQVVFMIAVPIGVMIFLNFLTNEGADIRGITPNSLPLFDFLDIWQNLTFVYSYFSILPGFIIVISAANEFSYGTYKQNLIDGLSKREFLFSKIYFIIAYAIAISLLALLIGLIIGAIRSPVHDFTSIIKHIYFIPTFTLSLTGFLLFCLLTTFVIRKAGFTIAFLVFYVKVVEPLITALIEYYYKLPWLADLFPIRIIQNVIPLPVKKYVFMYTQEYPGFGNLIALILLIALLIYLSILLSRKRDA